MIIFIVQCPLLLPSIQQSACMGCHQRLTNRYPCPAQPRIICWSFRLAKNPLSRCPCCPLSFKDVQPSDTRLRQATLPKLWVASWDGYEVILNNEMWWYKMDPGLVEYPSYQHQPPKWCLAVSHIQDSHSLSTAESLGNFRCKPSVKPFMRQHDHHAPKLSYWPSPRHLPGSHRQHTRHSHHDPNKTFRRRTDLLSCKAASL